MSIGAPSTRATRPSPNAGGVPAVLLEGVSKAYPYDGRPLEALHAVTLHVAAAEFVTVVGPSASGKSTMLNLIAGLERPTGGAIRLHGRTIDGDVGLVAHMPQRDLLLPWRRLLDNVILGPELQGVSREAARAEARALLPRFGLEGFETAYPRVLSGGMRQRAALLRTLLTHRDIMLLDEPFGALDALTRAQLQEWLLGIWDEFRKTVLFITHDVDEAVFLSDRVYVLSPRPGRVVLEVRIELPRPRRREMRLTPAFAAAKRGLLDALFGLEGQS
ncbi:MAG: ABC transporter ATP-binding protein [Actinobacteria bacterium]|nr:ABC transporter ATP-binding protein [Actinomycetota bacterium]